MGEATNIYPIYEKMMTRSDKEQLLVLCNLTEQEIHAELPDAWATAEKLIGNYVDNPSETLRPYECVVLHTTKE